MNTLNKSITRTRCLTIAAGLLLPATVFAGGNPQPECAPPPPHGTCRMVMPSPQRCENQRLWLFYMPQGYTRVNFNGTELYSYGDGHFYLPLSELRRVVYLPPP